MWEFNTKSLGKMCEARRKSLGLLWESYGKS